MDAFLSVVIPLRDAELYAEQFVREVQKVVTGLFSHYEIVLVDDASSDGTVALIQRLQASVENLQLYRLSRRSGLAVALVAGLDNSIGDFVITMNAEADSPELIPAFWQRAQQGNEVVCGVCHSDAPRKAFRRIFRSATGIDIPEGLTAFRLYSRMVVSYMTRNNDRHLILDTLPFFLSHRIATIAYTKLDRGSGFGRPGLWSELFSGVSAMLASSVRPLRLLTITAFLGSSLSLLFAVYVLVVALVKGHVVEGWVSLALPMATMFFLISLILGILSEYIYVLAQQSGNRPVYSISAESTSSVLAVQRKLNVVDATGEFLDSQKPSV